MDDGVGTILYGNYSTDNHPRMGGPVRKAPAPALKVTEGQVKVWIWAQAMFSKWVIY